jgi:hypothetical protein
MLGRALFMHEGTVSILQAQSNSDYGLPLGALFMHQQQPSDDEIIRCRLVCSNGMHAKYITTLLAVQLQMLLLAWHTHDITARQIKPAHL